MTDSTQYSYYLSLTRPEQLKMIQNRFTDRARHDDNIYKYSKTSL